MLISNLEYDDYVGRIALGRLKSGQLKTGGQEILLTHSAKTSVKRAKVAQVYSFEGLEMVSATSVSAGGDIAAFSGVEEIEIGGETVNEADHPLPLPAIAVDQPTLTMVLGSMTDLLRALRVNL